MGKTASAVENHAFAILEAVEYACQNINHQLIGDQLALVDITFSINSNYVIYSKK